MDIADSRLVAEGATNNYGLFLKDASADDGSKSVRIDSSQLVGVEALQAGNDYTLKIGGSRLDGTIDSGSPAATKTCVASWDGAYAALPTTCVPPPP